jgi:hypothetical protein
VPRIFLRFHQYHPAAALNLIMGNTEQRARSRFYARSRRTGSSSRTPSGTRFGRRSSTQSRCAPRGVPTR